MSLPRVVLKRIDYNENIISNIEKNVEEKVKQQILKQSSKIPRVVLERMNFGENGILRSTRERETVRKNEEDVIRETVYNNVAVNFKQKTDIKRKKKKVIQNSGNIKIPRVTLKQMDLEKLILDKNKKCSKEDDDDAIACISDDAGNEEDVIRETVYNNVAVNFKQKADIKRKKKQVIQNSGNIKIPRVTLEQMDLEKWILDNNKKCSTADDDDAIACISDDVEDVVRNDVLKENMFDFLVCEVVEESDLTYCSSCSSFYNNAVEHVVASPSCKITDVPLEPSDPQNQLDPENNTNVYICDTCNHAFTNVHEIKKHFHKHWPKIFSCIICDMEYITDSKLKRHMNCHGNKIFTAFTCNICSKSFSCSEFLKRHKNEHHFHLTKEDINTQRIRYVCDLCPKSFTNIKLLSRHKKMHSNIAHFTCEQCNIPFYNEYILNKHKEKLHNTNVLVPPGANATITIRKQFICEICNKTFKDNYDLKRHQYTHLQIKPYACNMCENTYAAPASLRRHKQNSHFNAEGGYPCDECTKVLKTKGSLMSHKKTHLNVTYTCDNCNKSYADISYFRKHKCKPVVVVQNASVEHDTKRVEADLLVP